MVNYGANPTDLKRSDDSIKKKKHYLPTHMTHLEDIHRISINKNTYFSATQLYLIIGR